MEKIYLVYRVVDDCCIIKAAFKTKEGAKAYKRFMDVEGQKAVASWIEEIQILPSIEYGIY